MNIIKKNGNFFSFLYWNFYIKVGIFPLENENIPIIDETSEENGDDSLSQYSLHERL